MYIIIYIDILKPQILPEGLEGRGDQWFGAETLDIGSWWLGKPSGFGY